MRGPPKVAHFSWDLAGVFPGVQYQAELPQLSEAARDSVYGPTQVHDKLHVRHVGRCGAGRGFPTGDQ